MDAARCTCTILLLFSITSVIHLSSCESSTSAQLSTSASTSANDTTTETTITALPTTISTEQNTTEAIITTIGTSESTTEEVPSFGAFHYYFVSSPDGAKTFDDAQIECTKIDSNLVSISSQQENDFILSLINKHSYNGTAWIGLFKQGINSTVFVWTDNTTLNYTNWANDFPSNSSNDDCVAAVLNSTDGTWQDVTCDTGQLAYICKQPIGSTVNPTEATTEPVTKETTHAPGNPSGLSHTELILIIVSLVLFGITCSLGLVWYIFKRKRNPRTSNFSLLENEPVADFRANVTNDGFFDN